MSKKSKKKKSLLDSRFYRIYFTVVGVALALILMGLICWQLFKPYKEANKLTVK